MARLTRIHVPGGLYYVHLRGNGGAAIFADAEDCYEFCRIVARAVRRSRARVHAYCWMFNHVRLAIEISDVPVGRVVQRIASQHSRRVHLRLGASGHLFERSYRALLVDSRRYLPDLVRHIHLTVVRAGAAANATDYAWCGHRAYLKLAKVPWLTTHVLLRRLARKPRDAVAAYRALMNESDEAQDFERFERARPGELPVLGDDQFLIAVTGGARQRRRAGTLDQLIEWVARTLDAPPAEILSPSRRRQLSLARALITFHATRSGLATLAEVSRKLNRDPSTLSVAVDRYRTARSDLFTDLPAGALDADAESWRVMARQV